jgi:hypothetical protein
MTEIRTMEETNKTKIINSGTGAGGANTNKNGLSYEKVTDLKDQFQICKKINNTNIYEVVFKGHYDVYINANKSELHKYMEKEGHKNSVLCLAAGCKQPDEAYIHLNRKLLFIIEKKFQQRSGSVDEKIQTGVFKQLHYTELFPNFKICYIYCLSDWFKQNEYASILNYLKMNGIPVFWGSSKTFKEDIIEFMHNSL